VRVLTVLGTRPEIIRLRCVIDVLDEATEHVLVHTGQNFDEALSDRFFRELRLRPPDVHLGVRSTGFAQQVGEILAGIGPVLDRERPDAVLVLGDTNSGLTAIVARRMGFPVFHMEAGNRCFDDAVPEEINRRLIDHCSSWLLPYTHRSKEHLLAEGVERRRIVVTGNPIREVLLRFEPEVASSSALRALGVEPRGYFLVTMHRAENVDQPDRLQAMADSLVAVSRRWNMPAVCSLHPRTADRMQRFGTRAGDVRFVEPLGFADFVALERDAACVLTDSGTVQEECCIFGVPAVTLRDVTERPETIECGSNVLAGVEAHRVVPAVEAALRTRGTWVPPAEYLVERVAGVVLRTILSAPAPGSGAAIPSSLEPVPAASS
jgi:UDP-N-acetylglucosamine 2-epimerase (non-hydrolysing)